MLLREENSVPNDAFPIPLNYIDVQRQTKTNIDVIHEANIGDCWHTDGGQSLSEPWDGCDKIRIAQPRFTRRTHVGSRQTDQETGHYKTWIFLARRTFKNVENLSAQKNIK